MAFGSIFKTQKHKRFEYRPVFYNPDKEELDERVKRSQLEAEKEKKGNTYVPEIKGKMKNYLISHSDTHTSHKNIRKVIMVVTMGLLIAIFYYLVEITEYIFSVMGK